MAAQRGHLTQLEEQKGLYGRGVYVQSETCFDKNEPREGFGVPAEET
jgi:hypothetical protein